MTGNIAVAMLMSFMIGVTGVSWVFQDEVNVAKELRRRQAQCEYPGDNICELTFKVVGYR